MARKKSGNPGMATVGYKLSQRHLKELEEASEREDRTKSHMTRRYVIRGLEADRAAVMGPGIKD